MIRDVEIFCRVCAAVDLVGSRSRCSLFGSKWLLGNELLIASRRVSAMLARCLLGVLCGAPECLRARSAQEC